MMSAEPLFPGFKVPPNDPSRELKYSRDWMGVPAAPPEHDMGDFDDGSDEETCGFCEGWGYIDCLCGGDFCVCDYYGEIPCYHCG